MYAAIRYAVYVLFDVSASSALFRVMVDGVAGFGHCERIGIGIDRHGPQGHAAQGSRNRRDAGMSFLNCIGTVPAPSIGYLNPRHDENESWTGDSCVPVIADESAMLWSLYPHHKFARGLLAPASTAM